LFFERSKLKYSVDDYEGAKKDCNEAIKFDSNNGEIYAHSSRLKFESGDDLNDALADCNKALDLDFYEPAVFYFRGAIQRNIGDFEEAIKSCCIAIKLDPKSEEVYKEQILMLEESVQKKLTAISDETDFNAKEKLNSVLDLINEEKKSF
jgi:tetratricopeptide (TPR) repeat protein